MMRARRPRSHVRFFMGLPPRCIQDGRAQASAKALLRRTFSASCSSTRYLWLRSALRAFASHRLSYDAPLVHQVKSCSAYECLSQCHWERGRVFLRVAEAPGEFIGKATAEVRVTGTAFGVSEEEGITTVNVVGGRVAVVSGGGSAQVERGQSAGAAADRPPAMIPDKPYAELAWARDVTAFKQ